MQIPRIRRIADKPRNGEEEEEEEEEEEGRTRRRRKQGEIPKE